MMTDLTPLDVRNKRGDFSKALRGYDPDEVNSFIVLVAERMEELVKQNLTLQERTERLQEQVASQEGREHAVREALVTAQELRRDMREQANREAELLRREAEAGVERIFDEARRRLEERRESLEELERSRKRFLRSFRQLLEREMDAVEVEESRAPLEDISLEIDFTAGDPRVPPSPPGEVADRAGPSVPGPERPPEGSQDSAGPPRTAAPVNAPESAPPLDENGDSLWLSTVLEEEEDGEREEDGWS